ncbi:MAG: hypothetical protein AAF617_02980 [Bacteroidota bacterium]
MKKKQVNLRQLALKKSKVASLESDALTGGTSGSWYTCGFQSWTGTAEPCFTDFDCNPGGGGGNPGGGGGNPGGGGGNPGGGGNTGGGYPTDACPSMSVCPPGIQCY